MRVDHVVEVGGPGTLAQSIEAVRVGGQISLVGMLTGLQVNGRPSLCWPSRRACKDSWLQQAQQQDYVAALDSRGYVRPGQQLLLDQLATPSVTGQRRAFWQGRRRMVKPETPQRALRDVRHWRKGRHEQKLDFSVSELWARVWRHLLRQDTRSPCGTEVRRQRRRSSPRARRASFRSALTKSSLRNDKKLGS